MKFNAMFFGILSILLSGCGDVRYLITKCTLANGSTVSMASKSFSNGDSKQTRSPHDVLPCTFTFNEVPRNSNISILLNSNNVLLNVGESAGWHLGDSAPGARSHYVLGFGVFVRIDFTDPNSLFLTVTANAPTEGKNPRPETAITRTDDDNILIKVDGFAINTNWTQAQVIANNTMTSAIPSEGHFSVPGKAGFEMRMPKREVPLEKP